MNAHSIVVGVDGSPDALGAVRWGAAEAARTGATLRLVHAFDHAADGVVGLPGLGDEYRTALLGQARRLLTDAAEVARREAAGVPVEEHLVTGYPIPVLVEETRHAALVVVGGRGRTRLGELLAGSVASALAAHGRCPAVVVRGGAPDPTRPIVLGVDGTPAGEAAVAFAFAAASARHVPLVAVHAWPLPFIGTVPVDPGVLAAAEESARKVLPACLAGWTEKFPDVAVRQVVANDRPAHLLLREAERAQLVVVGSRGHGLVAGMVLGSVSHALVHHAPCPVAVVRPDPAERP
jgi:nucleotide-binding universal stress UspA family protein